jgi:hypothetical protein
MGGFVDFGARVNDDWPDLVWMPETWKVVGQGERYSRARDLGSSTSPCAQIDAPGMIS